MGKDVTKSCRSPFSLLCVGAIGRPRSDFPEEQSILEIGLTAFFPQVWEERGSV